MRPPLWHLGGPLAALLILMPALGSVDPPLLPGAASPASAEGVPAAAPAGARAAAGAAGSSVAVSTSAAPRSVKGPTPVAGPPVGQATEAPAARPGCALSTPAALTPGVPVAGAPGVSQTPVRPGNGRRVPVSAAAGLTAALASARPGETIELANGRYPGRFVLNRAGTVGNPITLVGSCGSVLDGGAGGGYVLHLDGADHWRLAGFTVTGAEKGIMTDRANHTVLSHLTVGDTGAEAVHLGNFSSDDVVQSSLIHHTGKTKPQFGEGLYFGTAQSNWGSKSGGQPDASNGNHALGNAFRATTAENIDVKEATSGGLIAGNSFDGSGISGANSADSVLDVKGVRYRIVGNRTSGSSPALKDGFQTHVITDPASSGCGNTFADNTFTGLRFAGGQEVAEDKKCGK